jgi:hypothetical protein
LKEFSWLDFLKDEEIVVRQLLEIAELAVPHKASDDAVSGGNMNKLNSDLRTDIINTLPSIVSNISLHSLIVNKCCDIAISAGGENVLPAVLSTLSTLRLLFYLLIIVLID